MRAIRCWAVIGMIGALALVGCSGSDEAGDDEAAAARAADYVAAANEVCATGKVALGEVERTVDVVPEPETEAQREASDAWADATATELDAIAAALGALDPPEDRDDLARVADVYADAAEQVREEGTAVLGADDVNFLADDELHELGLTDCVAAERPDA